MHIKLVSRSLGERLGTPVSIMRSRKLDVQKSQLILSPPAIVAVALPTATTTVAK
ncbi:MAG TPA: hypothetical protein V6C85_11090 [Allocoleopsis sp.]